MTTMNDWIRAAGGRVPPADSQREGNPAASEAQLQAARLAGVPDAHAHRLPGEGRELVEDARSFAQQLGGSEPRTGFDGGARGNGVAAAPSMDSLIRGHRTALRERGHQHAIHVTTREDR